VLRPLLKFANKMHNASDEALSDLEAFILRRHANRRLNGNVRPQFLDGAGL